MEANKSVNGELTYAELLSQNLALSEELLKSNQDKDFIWNLWKELQVDNPNTTNMINTVMQREQEKSDAKDLKVLTVFEQKDKQIQMLQDVSADMQAQLDHGNKRISELLHLQDDWLKKSDEFNIEKQNLKAEIDYKCQLLVTKDQQLLLTEENTKDKNNLVNKLQELLEENTLYKKTIDSLNNKIEETCNQTDELKEKFSSKDEEMELIITKLDDEINQKEEILVENEQQTKTIKRLKDTIAQGNMEIDNVSKSLETRDNQVKSSKHTIRELLKKVKRREEDIACLKEELLVCEDHPKQIKEQTKIIQNLEKLQDETQLVLSQQEITHQREINTYKNTIYQLKLKMTKLQKDIVKITSESTSIKTNSSELLNKCNVLQDAENRLQQQLVSVSLELESVKKKNEGIGNIEKEKEKFIVTSTSFLNSCTQTSPNKAMRAKILYNEHATQTEDSEYSSMDLSDTSFLKIKKKKEKLHSETQRLLMLKSDMNQENRNLKKRLTMLENQGIQLLEAKQSIEMYAKELQATNQKLKDELDEALQKVEATTNVLHEKVRELEDYSEEVQTISASQMKDNIAFKNTMTKMKSVEEELRTATTNCSKLSFQVKTVCGENEILMEKQKGYQERITKLEKLLNQKKTYVEEMKTRCNEAKKESEKNLQTIENINKKLKTVTDRDNKNKNYIEDLKTKIDTITSDKGNLQETLNTMKAETENKTQLLQETRRICHQAEAAITAMEIAASQQLQNEHKSFEDNKAILNSQYENSVNRVNELKLVIKNFTESLLIQIHNKRGKILLTIKEKQKAAGKMKDNIFKQKARDVACSILNMSASDLEEFMDENVSDKLPLPKYEDNDIRQKLELILGKNYHFEKILTHFLLDLVEYYWSLCSSEIPN